MDSNFESGMSKHLWSGKRCHFRVIFYYQVNLNHGSHYFQSYSVLQLASHSSVVGIGNSQLHECGSWYWGTYCSLRSEG